jgi:hypothetical protein
MLRRCLPFTLVVLVACSTSDSSKVVAKVKEVGVSSTGHKYGPPTGKIRVANLLDMGGHPFGPIDVYDVSRPDSSTAPLIKGLAYGQVSAYVSPRAGDPCAGCSSNLYVFPAGARTASSPFGSTIDNGGFQASDQLTVGLGPSKGFGDAPSMSMTTIVEAGPRLSMSGSDRDNATMAPGQGLLISRAANMSLDSLPELYLMIDGTCPHATNDRRVVGDTVSFKKEPSSVGPNLYYPVAAGTHTLAIVTSPRGHALLTCMGETPGPSTTVTVSPGQRTEVWVYGVPADGYKAVAAIIAP